MKNWICILFISAIYTTEKTDIDSVLFKKDAEYRETLKITKITPHKEGFYYISIGGHTYAPILLYYPIALPEIALGWRGSGSSRIIDVNFGGSIEGLLYGQSSYLFYPMSSDKGIYCGAGITILHTLGDTDVALYMPFSSRHDEWGWNVPFTLGYQTESESGDSHQFVQFQITPLYTVTLSYGSGF